MQPSMFFGLTQVGKTRPAGKAHRCLRAECLENVGPSTFHNPIDLHSLFQGVA
jgi:hypothetical protein